MARSTRSGRTSSGRSSKSQISKTTNPLLKVVSSKNSTSRRNRSSRSRTSSEAAVIGDKSDIANNPLMIAIHGKPKVSKEEKVKNNPLFLALSNSSVTKSSNSSNTNNSNKSIKSNIESKVTENLLYQALHGGRQTRSKGPVRSSNPQRSGAPNKSSQQSHQEQSTRLNFLPTSAQGSKSKSKSRFKSKSNGPTSSGSPSSSSSSSYIYSDIQFKDASKVKFLRITNLKENVTSNDVETIMSKFGKVLKVFLKEQYSNVFHKSATAEIFFLNQENLILAQTELNGRLADGVKIQVEIATESDIITDANDWERLLRDVRREIEGYKRIQAQRSILIDASPRWEWSSQ